MQIAFWIKSTLLYFFNYNCVDILRLFLFYYINTFILIYIISPISVIKAFYRTSNQQPLHAYSYIIHKQQQQQQHKFLLFYFINICYSKISVNADISSISDKFYSLRTVCMEHCLRKFNKLISKWRHILLSAITLSPGVAIIQKGLCP